MVLTLWPSRSQKAKRMTLPGWYRSSFTGWDGELSCQNGLSILMFGKNVYIGKNPFKSIYLVSSMSWGGCSLKKTLTNKSASHGHPRLWSSASLQAKLCQALDLSPNPVLPFLRWRTLDQLSPPVVQTQYFCLGAWNSFKDLKVFPNYLYFNPSWLGKSG